MKKIYINNIGGLYNEFYNPVCISSDINFPTKIQNEYLDANLLFWNKLLDVKNIENVVNLLIENIGGKLYSSYKNLSIVCNPDLFIQNVLTAKEKVCDQGNSPQEFFGYLETLAIMCNLYSSFWFNPYKLSLDNGINFNELSSETIAEVALNPAINPLYIWIRDEILPVILEYKPEIVFLEGQPSVFFFTIAKLLKQHLSSAHICITKHSSEYFSLNKIDYCLRENKVLFHYIDSIILEFYENTEKMLVDAIESGCSLANVNNIIYRNSKKEIIQTPYQKNAPKYSNITKRNWSNTKKYKVSPSTIVNVHLEPYKKCYWNKCTFCGINKKYHYVDSSDIGILDQLKRLQKLIEESNIKYIWFLDEAIHPEKLRIIAEFFLKNNISVFWQARCRIENELIKDDLPKLLYCSGLRELRLGLESGSYHILQLMNKFPDNFSYALLEEIVSRYDKEGISIHTPIIIGFPGETKSDRQKTYELLRECKEKYHLFSFNINILGMDISSILFKEWSNYEIKSISLPCKPDNYLGNLVNWEGFDSCSNYEKLDRERNNFMRELLYPWMPHDTLIQPHIMYRLSETIRNTLIWKVYNISDYKLKEENYFIKCAENIIVTPLKDISSHLIYHWENHHYLIASKLFLDIYEIWRQPKHVEDSIIYIKDNITNVYSYNELKSIILKLIFCGFLLPIDLKNPGIHNKSKVEVYYDNIYSSKHFPYAVRKDSWIEYYRKFIPIGNALELGIGNGKNIPTLLEMGYTVNGIDISGEAINQLRNQYDNNKCYFEQADIRDYRIPPNSYDLIICSMVLHYFEPNEIESIVCEMIQGMKKNGVLFISALSNHDPLNKVPESENPYVKTFFSCTYLKKLVERLKVIELSDSYMIEPLREHPCNYFGIITYMGKKYF